MARMSASNDEHRPAPAQRHSRHWRDNLYVYPVISRRARGLSVGVNLSPDQVCNFGCIYCQVNRRRKPPNTNKVDLAILRAELNTMLGLAASGQLWRDPAMSDVSPALRRVNDIAFSGDGEPTCYVNFDQAVALAAEARREHAMDGVKIIVISNASCLHTRAFQRALPLLEANHGEVWAKLDAGTPEYFRLVDNPRVPYQRVLDNILSLSRRMPIIIQTMFLRVDGQGPPEAEIDAYTARLRHVLAEGGRILQVQLYTVARPPAQSRASALADAQLDAIAARVRAAVPEVPVSTYYGADVPPQEPG